MREYYELYANKLYNLSETDRFPGIYKILKLTCQKEIENVMACNNKNSNF